MNVQFSRHARFRASQRGLTDDEIAFVLFFGRSIHRTGIRFVFLGQRDIPARFGRTHGHLAGLTVLVSHEGTVLTVYKNQAALRTIKKKDKRAREVA
jgi:hypothetical protein